MALQADRISLYCMSSSPVIFSFFTIDFDYLCRLVTVGLTNSNMKFANLEDENMLDVSGFDARVPKVIRTFVSGEY